MAVAMLMHWPGLTSDQYDAVMARLGLDANPPAGGVLHVAAVSDEGVEVLTSGRPSKPSTASSSSACCLS